MEPSLERTITLYYSCRISCQNWLENKKNILFGMFVLVSLRKGKGSEFKELLNLFSFSLNNAEKKKASVLDSWL